ncbi:MAG: polysaccharide biosynthesis/export family protein [Desulfonauticus sp.]|nr:polysaccharide biosynthesis/export family protein [Desulfonauticus sp.]
MIGGGGKKLLLNLVFLLMIVGCSSPQYGIEVPMSGATFSFDQGLYPSDLDLFSEYRVIPGDVLDVLFQIHSWKPSKEFKIGSGYTVSIKFLDVPSLDQTQTVLPDGTIVLPYIGRYKVFDKTIEQITKELKRAYRKILRQPEIYVVVPEFQTRIKELRQDLHTAPRGLSKLVTVRPDGYATFPLVGQIFVAHRTIPELNKILNKKYEKILPGLHVDLFLHRHAGSVIYVLGEVLKPGSYQIKKPLNVIQVIALAGSFTHEADLTRVVVFRKHERKIIARVLNLSSTLSLQSNSNFFFLKPDDIVFVPRKNLSTIAQIMREIADTIFFKGWSVGFSYDISNKF